MFKPLIALPLIAFLTTGCVTVPQVNEDGSTVVRLGQTANLGGPRVIPLKVLEDSRCPMEVECFWAGRVRLQVRIELGSGTSLQELASDRPLQVADGQLELLATMPPSDTRHKIAPKDYRFALKFSGGL